MTSTLPALDSFRAEFPALANKVYLNFGGQGPLARSTSQAIAAAYAYEQQEGPFCKTVNSWITDQIAQLRHTLATYLGTTPDRIALTESTTSGMNIPLWGLDWHPGDQILYTDAEHPGVRAIAQAIAQRFGVELIRVPLMYSPDPVATLQEFITPHSRMVVISHVLWNTGRVLPLRELAHCCHSHGLVLHVDAAQSAGVLPLDLPGSGVDFYAFTGHKWLCGPAGVGALYISETAQERLRPTYVGFRSLKGKGKAAEYEVSTVAWPLFIGWKTAIELHDQQGPVQERHQRQLQKSRSLWERLGQIPGVTCLNPDPPGSGLVGFTIEGQEPGSVESALAEQKILIRSMSEPACLRASVHYLTTEQELDRVVEAIQEIARA